MNAVRDDPQGNGEHILQKGYLLPGSTRPDPSKALMQGRSAPRDPFTCAAGV
ncbi:hypothetical protein E4U13_005967 [Claviceps humidiphila]|uniref:Uncharacterized protein n=1 Tax=Claviceps humidiphila TaxID=1294629 RepID=A0A9P7QAU3_9HYPO|nr:hypothetical protein E4U13_005967 [Claviceps humidiphila]